MPTSAKLRGFTLIELIITVTLLGILASIMIAVLKPAFLFGQARDANRRVDLKQIQNSLQLYKNVNGTYPNPGGGWNWVNSNYLSPWIPGLTSTLVKTLPTDPKNTCPASANYAIRTESGYCYEYQYAGNVGCGDNYWLATKLESDTSTQYSKQTIYYPPGTACYTWTEHPEGWPSLYVLSADD